MTNVRTFHRNHKPLKRHKWRDYLSPVERDTLIYQEARELRALHEVTERRKEIRALRKLGMDRAADADRAKMARLARIVEETKEQR